MKRIAIITGASSGMGREFALTALQHVEVDELWLIARRKDRLEEVRSKVENQKSKVDVVCLDLDLSLPESVAAIGERLKVESAVKIELLINAAGYGKFQAVQDITPQMADNMLALNCRTLMQMCYTCLPYMSRGSKILNIASVAAFQPVPYLTEYAATKAFVLSFSRGLWSELRKDGITVTALCPYWTRTEFFEVAKREVQEQSPIHYYNAMYEAKDLVARGWRDLLKGRDISTYGFIARAQVALIKVLPHRLVMWIWRKQQGIK